MTIEDPLAVVAGNHFEGKFTEQPSETSLNYINLPRARRIVPLDALSWVSAFNAGYEPRLDCTAVRQKLFPWDALQEFYLAPLVPIPRVIKGELLCRVHSPFTFRYRKAKGKREITRVLMKCTSKM